jgi:small subunit ribosomal protein S9
LASSALNPTEYYATGRRKTSTARVFLRPGTGTITVNHREFANYFPTEMLRMNVRRPLVLTEVVDKFDIVATVAGGGVNSQSGAVRLGIARALTAFNAELRRALKKDGLLTSDSRVKERKKYGLAGARKRFQFSKR